MRKAAVLARLRLAHAVNRLEGRDNDGVIVVRAGDVRELLNELERLGLIVHWSCPYLPITLRGQVERMLSGEHDPGAKAR